MGKGLEGIVLACRQRGLTPDLELYLLLPNNDLFNAPRVRFARGWIHIHDKTVSDMGGGPGVVHPAVRIMCGSGFSLDTGVCWGFVAKVEAKVESK
jgi:hypothetical protein